MDSYGKHYSKKFFISNVFWYNGYSQKEIIYVDVRLVPKQSENGKYNLISVRFNKISLCVCTMMMYGKGECMTDLTFDKQHFYTQFTRQTVLAFDNSKS